MKEEPATFDLKETFSESEYGPVDTWVVKVIFVDDTVEIVEHEHGVVKILVEERNPIHVFKIDKEEVCKICGAPDLWAEGGAAGSYLTACDKCLTIYCFKCSCTCK